MKKYIFIYFILLNFTSSFTQTYYINVNLKDGTKITYEISNISKIDFNDVTSIEDLKKLQNVVKSFKLMQNYPNPFNPSTTIQYEIPNNGKVEVSVFDINGRLVKSLVDKFQKIGLHSVLWNGQNNLGTKVSSGLYVYLVKFENSLFSKKMILLK